MAKFEEYQNRYEDWAFLRREDRVLEIRVHTDGGSAVFNGKMHDECSELFRQISQDYENRAVIYTGTGERFMDPPDVSVMKDYLPYTPALHTTVLGPSARVLTAFLEIEVPVITAINGPAPAHAELMFLSDVAIAAEEAYFSEFHFRNGLVPGDGTHIVWPLALGLQRAQYYLLTGNRITSEEALRMGMVQEVLPRENLQNRAWELAREIAQQDPVTLRLTRALYTHPLKKSVNDSIMLGLACEGLTSIDHWPTEIKTS